jgi:hypothetical protein
MLRPDRKSTVILWSLLLGVATTGTAQAPVQRAGPFRLLPEAEEVALARSAAPPGVSDSATVYVLRSNGFVRAVNGTNGVECFVGRDHPESLYPICYDEEAARTILPTEFFEVEQRIAGRTEDAIAGEVERRFKAGVFATPQRGALTWMMSPGQVLYDLASGRRAGAWHPHVMIYLPGATPAILGLAALAGTSDFQVSHAGTPRAHLVIHTATWSDGTAH